MFNLFINLGTVPFPRSLHSACVLNQKMYVFGGWVPLTCENDSKTGTLYQEKEWKCTNTLAVLNLDSMYWEYSSNEIIDDTCPRARAGHSAVVINTRIYIWSGRDGYRKAWNNQVCCKDLWFLETEIPSAPVRLQLAKASTNSFDISWNAVPTADCYIVQIQMIDSASSQQSEANASSTPKKLMPPPTSIPSDAPPLPSPTLLEPTPTPAVTSTAANAIPASSPAIISGNESSPVKVLSISKPGTTSTTAVATTSAMSGMAVLVAAATATPKITTQTVTAKTSSGQNIRIISPQTSQSGGVIQTVKMTSGASPQTFRFITSQAGTGGTKQILLKTSGGQSHPQVMTLVKTSQGTLALTPKMSGTQVVKLVAQNASKSSSSNILTTQTVQSVTGQISSTNLPASSNPVMLATSDNSNKDASTTLINQPKIQNSPQQPLKMIVLPSNSNRSQSVVLQNAQGVQSGQQVSIRLQSPLQSNKTIKIPASAIKSINQSALQSGSSKLVLSSSGTIQPGSIRIISASGSNTTQRVVLISTQSLTTTSSSVVNTITSLNSSSTPSDSNRVNSISTENIVKIPQTDGPDDDEFPLDFMANNFSGDQSNSSPQSTVPTNTTNGSSLTTPYCILPSDSSNNQSKPEPIEPIDSSNSAVTSNSNSNTTLNPNSNVVSDPKSITNQWYDVGIFKQHHCTISGYYIPKDDSVPYDQERNMDTQNIPQYSNFSKVSLLPGTSYKIRVAAFNVCGRGPWSEVFTNVKTCVPGYPPAPTSIKITKNNDGAQLSWNIAAFQDEILEYSVYLSVKPDKEKPPTSTNTLSFLKVYNGIRPCCVVNQHFINNAQLDHTSKPAIIFRIAARNAKGYGPATQVRWLQDALSNTGNRGNKRSSASLND